MTAGTASRYPEPDDALLAQYCETRDVKLRNEVLQQYLYLPQIVARRFAGKGIEYDDLIQVASLALITALERFDCGKGVKFASFAMPTLIGVVKNHFRDKLRMVRLPRRESEQLQAMDKAIEELQKELGAPPRPEKLAQHMGVALETIYELQEARASAYTASLDSARDEEVNLLGQLGAPDEALERFVDREAVSALLTGLNSIEREVVRGRFFGEKSQRDLAAELGVSQMYISRLEKKILLKMRTTLDA